MVGPMVTAEKRLAFRVTAPAPRTTNRRTAERQTRAVADTVAWVQELLDRFPPEGLAEAARALDLPPLARIGWFVRPNPFLEGRAPIEALRAGERERVLDAALG